MSRKSAIWGGLFIGSFIGGLVPNLWGADYFSFSGVVSQAVFSILGIWLGFKLSA
ncbi:hypothetical protein KW790_01080 [Candidatus Parcubacteria bacterium]|nr:hypothetical protein [Candidatus Parcubacteria bacterium]